MSEKAVLHIYYLMVDSGPGTEFDHVRYFAYNKFRILLILTKEEL